MKPLRKLVIGTHKNEPSGVRTVYELYEPTGRRTMFTASAEDAETILFVMNNARGVLEQAQSTIKYGTQKEVALRKIEELMCGLADKPATPPESKP